MNFSKQILKWFLGISKAKKHDWKVHKNNSDLKKFWGQHFGMPKCLDLNWQPRLKYLQSILNTSDLKVGMSMDRVHGAVKEHTVPLNYQAFPTADTLSRTGEVHTILAKHISLISKLILTQWFPIFKCATKLIKDKTLIKSSSKESALFTTQGKTEILTYLALTFFINQCFKNFS